jgi:hypothetical protein
MTKMSHLLAGFGPRSGVRERAAVFRGTRVGTIDFSGIDKSQDCAPCQPMRTGLRALCATELHYSQDSQEFFILLCRPRF